jgi:hypothetical protein
MSTLQPTDKVLVSRAGTPYSTSPDMSTVQDTDLIVVNRSGIDYKCTFEDWQAAQGPGIAKPVPGQVSAIPAFSSGSGTQLDPFIIPAATCQLGSTVQSTTVVRFTNLRPLDLVEFVDLNSTTNGARFLQTAATVKDNGTYSYSFRYKDVPPASGQSFTGLLRCGTVYFSWEVTNLDKGIEAPTIQEVRGLNGLYYVAPTEPAYITETSVGHVYPITPLTGLTISTKTSNLTTTGGTGSGLTISIQTTSTGSFHFAQISTAGSGYKQGDVIRADLSSIGGSASQEFHVSTNPVTASTCVVKVTQFVGINVGAFASSEWLISESADFSSPRTVTTTVNSDTLSINTGVGGSKEYYMKFRYVEAGGMKSEYSQAVRFHTGPIDLVKYALSGFFGGVYESGDILLASSAYKYLVTIVNPNQRIATHGLANGGSRNGVGGDGTCCPLGMYIQTRMPVAIRVDNVSAGGAIVTASIVSQTRGISDSIHNGSVVTLPTKNGGTAASVQLRRDADGFTTLVGVVSQGTNYTVGDILTYTCPVGNGVSPSMDSQNDILIHGLGGYGGGSSMGGGAGAGGYLTADGGTSTDQFGRQGVGGKATYTLYPTIGGNGSGSVGENNDRGAGGGGAGWLGGGGGLYDDNEHSRGGPGGGGGGCWHDAALMKNGAVDGGRTGPRQVLLTVNEKSNPITTGLVSTLIE